MSPNQAILTKAARPGLKIQTIQALTASPSSVLLFDAAFGWPRGDMIARFWQGEFQTLDWLRDYLRDENVVLMVDSFDEGWEEEDEGTEMYSKADLQNLATESFSDF